MLFPYFWLARETGIFVNLVVLLPQFQKEETITEAG
jgi:hypothetical protein